MYDDYACVFRNTRYWAVSGLFQNIDPPPHPLSTYTQRVWSSPRIKGGGEGGYTLAGRWGGGGCQFLFWKTPDIGLVSFLQYNLCTMRTMLLYNEDPINSSQRSRLPPSTSVFIHGTWVQCGLYIEALMPLVPPGLGVRVLAEARSQHRPFLVILKGTVQWDGPGRNKAHSIDLY